MPTVTNATPVPPSTVDYNSTVTYTCQDVHSNAARDLIITCKADGLLIGSSPVCTTKLKGLFGLSVIKISSRLSMAPVIYYIGI